MRLPPTLNDGDGGSPSSASSVLGREAPIRDVTLIDIKLFS